MLELPNLNPPYTRTDFLPQREQKDGYILKLLMEDEQRKADNSSLHALNISYYHTFGDLFDLEKDLQKAVQEYNKVYIRAVDLGLFNPKAEKDASILADDDGYYINDIGYVQVTCGRMQIILHETGDDQMTYEDNPQYILRAIYATVQRDLLEAGSRLQRIIDKFEDKFPGYLNRDALENKSTLGY